MIWLYNLLLTLLSPLWVPWMLIRSRRRAEDVDWKERTGTIESRLDRERPRVWVHAVSVGEVVAALPILRELKARRPDVQIFLTTTTSSGQRTARERAADLADQIAYFPIDVVRFQLSALTRIRPHVVAVMETELWMNFLWAAQVVGAQTLLVNGRISDRSWSRSRRIAFFYRSLLRNLDRALMQTPRDQERIRGLGARETAVLGNAKFDEAADLVGSASAADVRADLGIPADAPVLVVGSTRSEEEETLVLDAVTRAGIEGLHVVYAPRHLERAGAVAAQVRARGLGEPALRSRGEAGPFLILDTYGELGRTYAAADVAVVGGGFGPHGGQNLIQPLAHGVPVLHGPNMQNFAEVARRADESGAARTADSAEALAVELRRLFADPGARAAMAQAARALIAEETGAAARYADAIARELPPTGAAGW